MAIIKLTHGYEAIVDDWNYERLNRFNWYTRIIGGGGRNNPLYAARNSQLYEGEPHRTIFLHHQVLNITPKELNGKVVDHIDRNSFNCREENLRIVTQLESMQNTNKVINKRGVSYHIRSKKWQAYLSRPGLPTLHLGMAKTEQEALALVAVAKEKYHGGP